MQADEQTDSDDPAEAADFDSAYESESESEEEDELEVTDAPTLGPAE